MNNQKTLLIVESPTKAKKIAAFLGNNYVVRASMGHVADLAKSGEFNLGIDLKNEFKTKYAVLPDKVELLDQLAELAKEAKEVILAPDPDREGTAIAFHLYSKLKSCGKPFKRILLKEITEKGVLSAIENYEDITSEKNLNIFNAQESRRILDRVVGFMGSPFVVNFFGKGQSCGRVQSVITRMVVDREREIEQFIPEEYWVLKSNLSKDNKESFWAKYEPKVSNQTKAADIRKILEGNNFDATYVVSQVIAKEELKHAPPPMITSQLQKVMSKNFGINPDATMKAAQWLYENGHITYMRTDSTRADPDAIKDLRNYLKNQGFEIPKTANNFKNKDAAQDAHECIRPTDLTFDADNELIGDEKQVYSVIWKCFVASQMPPAIYNTLKISLQLKDQKQHVLKTSGKALKSKGFLEIMGVDDNSKIDIPNLVKGDELSLFGKNPVSSEKKFTQPLPRFSNYSLIELLEKKSIGRPATYAEVLSKITSRNYVEMEGTTYRPTELGKKITDALSKSFAFMEYNYTADLEKKLDDVEQGKEDRNKMLEDFYKPFKEQLDKAYLSMGSDLCDKCNSPMKIRQSKTGDKFLGCQNFPHCYNTKPFSEKKSA